MFNDNLLKMVVILLLVGPRSTEAAQQAVTFQCFLAYTLPYVLLSLPAGALADAFSKRRVLVTLKLVEVAVMLLAGLALADGGRPALLVVLCLVGTLSALSSPSKYGLLPELLAESKLAGGNGVFLLASWSATILGTGLAGALLDLVGPQRRGQVGLVLAALSVAGTLFALRIPRGVAAGVRASVPATARAGWRAIVASRSLRMAVLGSTFFWTLGALLQQDVVVFSKSALDLSDTGTSLLQAALALGIGLGSVAVGRLTPGRLGVRWVHRGAASMGTLLLLLGLLPASIPLAGIALLLVGVSSGLILVPLNSLAQGRSAPEHRGAVIAVLNLFVFLGVLLGSLCGALLGRMGQPSTAIFVVAGGAALLGAVWARATRAHLEQQPTHVAP